MAVLTRKRKARWSLLPYVLATVIITSALVPWPELVTHLFETVGFESQKDAFGGDARLALLHLLTDSFIGLSYLVISLSLMYLAHRARQSLPFLWAFVAFGAFIVSCGLTHFVAAVTLWEPVYWLAGGVKYVTAVASVGTAVAVPSLIPKVLALVDNARLVARNQQLESALDQRDAFLHIASHELRTPLTTLRGYAQLGLRTLSRSEEIDREKLERALRSIDRQSEKLNRLIAQLLDVSRLDTGQLALALELTDLGALAEAVVAAGVARTDRHQITLAAETGLSATVDPLRLEQVLTNLLDNAIKYSPAGGDIDIVLARRGADRIELAVRDHGLGVPPDQRDRLFERYFRGHSADHYSGMGLGLAIGRQIVELHGGSLRAEFPHDGGSRFVVSLPAAATSDGAARAG